MQKGNSNNLKVIYGNIKKENNMSEEEILKYLYYFTSSNIKNKKLD